MPFHVVQLPASQDHSKFNHKAMLKDAFLKGSISMRPGDALHLTLVAGPRRARHSESDEVGCYILNCRKWCERAMLCPSKTAVLCCLLSMLMCAGTCTYLMLISPLFATGSHLYATRTRIHFLDGLGSQRREVGFAGAVVVHRSSWKNTVRTGSY